MDLTSPAAPATDDLASEAILDEVAATAAPPARRARLIAAIKGYGWSGLSQVLANVVRLGSNLILTRLLVPEVYGLFGVALAVIGTLEFFTDFGVQPALMRHPDGMTRRYLLTGWSVGVSRGAGLSVVIVALAPLVAWFEVKPSLVPVLAVLAIRPILWSLRSPAMPALRRNMDYRSIFLIEMTELFAATATSIAVAALTRSIWAIVAGTLAGTAAGGVASYLLAPIRPAWLWDRDVLAQVSGLGRQIIVNTMAMALWLNLDRVLGSRYVPVREMGFYVVALTLATSVEMLIVKACDVYFSMLTRHPDPEARRRWNKKFCLLVSVAAMPAFAALIVAAPTIIGLLYKPEWAPAKAVLGILIARVMVRGLAQVQFEYLLVVGDIRDNTRAYFVAAAVQAAVLFPLVSCFGLLGLPIAGLASATAYLAAQTIPMRLRGDVEVGPMLITVGWGLLGLALLYARMR